MSILQSVLTLLPILWLIVALAVLKIPGHKACLVALVIAAALALTLWHMPVVDCVTSALEGFAAALWPIILVIIAAIEALNGPQDEIAAMREAFQARRDHLVARMNEIDGVSCMKPQGAFYVMMNMKSFIGKTMYGQVIHDDNDFAKLFLEKGLVATVPCSAFAAPGFIRWSYATSMQEIDKGLDRLEAFIKNA